MIPLIVKIVRIPYIIPPYTATFLISSLGLHLLSVSINKRYHTESKRLTSLK